MVFHLGNFLQQHTYIDYRSMGSVTWTSLLGFKKILAQILLFGVTLIKLCDMNQIVLNRSWLCDKCLTILCGTDLSELWHISECAIQILDMIVRCWFDWTMWQIWLLIMWQISDYFVWHRSEWTVTVIWLCYTDLRYNCVTQIWLDYVTNLTVNFVTNLTILWATGCCSCQTVWSTSK